jgi:uncharacterized protein YvpB
MTQTTAPRAQNAPLTVRPTTASQKPRPAPSRTPYRPAGDTSFTGALRAAVDEAKAARLAMLADPGAMNPAAARIGAPAAEGSASGAVLDAMAPPPGVDARLWESLVRGAPLPGGAAQGAAAVANGPGQAAAMAVPAGQTTPVAQAITPAMLREQGQAFLRSIKGFDQTKVDEYESVAQARAWGYSTCSAASLTAVLRAAGQDVKVSDVMKQMPGGMTIKLGLVSRPSLVNAANHFGAKATDDVRGYEALKEATESGQPVLVDIRNGKFPEGHWIVVTGVDEHGVRCADSSRYDLTSIPQAEFLRSWSSRGIRLEGLTPGNSPASPAGGAQAATAPRTPSVRG